MRKLKEVLMHCTMPLSKFLRIMRSCVSYLLITLLVVLIVICCGLLKNCANVIPNRSVRSPSLIYKRYRKYLIACIHHFVRIIFELESKFSDFHSNLMN